MREYNIPTDRAHIVDKANWYRYNWERGVESYHFTFLLPHSTLLSGAADKLRQENFHLEKHSDALKAVAFSRAVQNGQTGCKDLFVIAAHKLGQPNLSYIDDAYFDEKIISAIYDYLIAECDLAMPVGGVWRSPDDFCHGGKQIILALRSRFTRERADALALLTGGR